MGKSWSFKQAKLIYTQKLEDFEKLYDANELEEIKKLLGEIEALPDFLKREIEIDTFLE